mgnify:CR=1 FL=1
MAELKSQKNSVDVGKFIAGIKEGQQRVDCEAPIALMQKLTDEPPVMWGKAMVGFETFRYRGETSGDDWFPQRKQKPVTLSPLNFGQPNGVVGKTEPAQGR